MRVGQGKQEALPVRPPNPYEAPGCHETDFPSERILLIFPAWGVLAPSAVGRVV
jgi:hypothetical protein